MFSQEQSGNLWGNPLPASIHRQAEEYARQQRANGNPDQTKLNYVTASIAWMYLEEILQPSFGVAIRIVEDVLGLPLEVMLDDRTVRLQGISILPDQLQCNAPEGVEIAGLYLLFEIDWNRNFVSLLGFAEAIDRDCTRNDFDLPFERFIDRLEVLLGLAPSAPALPNLQQRVLSFLNNTWQAWAQAAAGQFESTKPRFHSWVLEPQLTPSALIGGTIFGLDPYGDDLPFDGLDGDDVYKLHSSLDDLPYTTDSDDPATLEDLSAIAFDAVDTEDDIEWQSSDDVAQAQDPALQVGSAASAGPSLVGATPVSSGVFLVGPSGQVSFEFVYDGGNYAGEVAIFSLQGMDPSTFGSDAFNYEAASRALGLSESGTGHVVISDINQGAGIDTEFNQGAFAGVQTFTMTPGATFGIMLIPDGSVQELYNNYGNGSVVYSMNNGLEDGNLVSSSDYSEAYGFEDIELGPAGGGNTNNFKDFDDVIFRMSGATGHVPQHDFSYGVAHPIGDYIEANPLPAPTQPNDPVTPPTSSDPINLSPPDSVNPSPPSSPPEVIPGPSDPVSPGTGVEAPTTPPVTVSPPVAVLPEDPAAILPLPDTSVQPQTIASQFPAGVIDFPATIPTPLSNPTLSDSAGEILVADTEPAFTLQTYDAGVTSPFSLSSGDSSEFIQIAAADLADKAAASLQWESVAKVVSDLDLLALQAKSILPLFSETVQFIVVLEVFSRLLATNSSLSYRQLRSLLGWTETGIKATGTRLSRENEA